MAGATIVNATNAGSVYSRGKAATGPGGRFSAIHLNALLREAGQPWLMGPSTDIGDKGEIGAVVGSSAVANAGDLFPDSLVYRRETGVARGPGVNFGDFQTIGQTHPLGVDFRAPDDGNLSDETPQRIGCCDLPGGRQRGRHHSSGRAKIAVAGHDDIGAPTQRPAQGEEGLAAHYDRLAHRHRLEALQIGLQMPGYGTPRADHAIVGDGNDEDGLHQRVPRASVLSASPPTLHTVHSSSMTAPSDL